MIPPKYLSVPIYNNVVAPVMKQNDERCCSLPGIMWQYSFLSENNEIKSVKPVLAKHEVADMLMANHVIPEQMAKNQVAIKKQNPDRRVEVLWKAAFITQAGLSYRCT